MTAEPIDQANLQNVVRNYRRSASARRKALTEYERTIAEYNRAVAATNDAVVAYQRVSNQFREIAKKQRELARESERASDALRRHQEVVKKYRDQYFAELEALAPDDKLREAIETAKQQPTIPQQLLDQWRKTTGTTSQTA